MKKKLRNIISTTAIAGVLCCLTLGNYVMAKSTVNTNVYSGISESVYNMLLDAEKEPLTKESTEIAKVAEPAPIEPIFTLNDGEIELLAFIMVAEAEGESEYGKRLVVDTILNRMDSETFPNTVYEVAYQPNQFSSMWNGRICRVSISSDDIRLVEEELLNRTNNTVMFFTAGRYSNYGTPLFQEGNHCFSGL